MEWAASLWPNISTSVYSGVKVDSNRKIRRELQQLVKVDSKSKGRKDVSGYQWASIFYQCAV